MGRNSTYSKYLRQCRRCNTLFHTQARDGKICSSCYTLKSGGRTRRLICKN